MALQRYTGNGYPTHWSAPKIFRHSMHLGMPRMNTRPLSRWAYDNDPMRYLYALGYNQNDIAHHRERLRHDIQDWAVSCLETNTQYNPLDIDDAIRTFEHLVSYVSSAIQADDDDYRIGDELLQDLEARLRVDRYNAMAVDGQVTKNCQHYFRILAEISRHCSSDAIAEVLYYFLSCNHEWIVDHNTTPALEQWVRAVLVSHMHQSEKRECISRLVEHEPEIVDRMLRKGHDGVRQLSTESERILQAVAHNGYRVDSERDDSSEYWHDRSRYGGAERSRNEHKLHLREDIDHHKKQLQRKKQELKDMDRRYGRSNYGSGYNNGSSRMFRRWPGRSDHN